ncbi:dynein beta chain, ciliary-like [Frankliniella occidentalis]|uniref:Dynein beta chain, ciliary-like n=1 Tax=Frankliniella occidentalis TaxID=133901 RepID=A0A9C6XV82_FRAOC|nr:dynein beta chain, ciliary-like [Frankliniella occidentalis]
MAADTEEPKKDAAPGGSEDERLEFIFEYLSKSLRLKQEKWAKMMSNEELRFVVMEFLERTTSNVLVMLLSPAGVLTPVLGFPTNAKGKSSYFIRKRKEPVTKENLRDLLIFGDMAPRPVEELAVLVDEVFMPLLVNPVNQRGWPTVVAEDVKKHLYGLKCDLYEVRGRMNGQTLLPMPLNVAKVYQVHRDLVDRWVKAM